MDDKNILTITNRLAKYLHRTCDADCLKSTLDELFKEVSIIAITAHESELEFPHHLKDGMYYLRDLIDILDSAKASYLD